MSLQDEVRRLEEQEQQEQQRQRKLAAAAEEKQLALLREEEAKSEAAKKLIKTLTPEVECLLQEAANILRNRLDWETIVVKRGFFTDYTIEESSGEGGVYSKYFSTATSNGLHWKWTYHNQRYIWEVHRIFHVRDWKWGLFPYRRRVEGPALQVNYHLNNNLFSSGGGEFPKEELKAQLAACVHACLQILKPGRDRLY